MARAGWKRGSTAPVAGVLPLSLLILIAAGCAASPHLGQDEGRAAVVWENPSLAPAPKPTASGDTERELVAEVNEAERNDEKPLALANSLYELAILRRHQGQSGEAERLYQRALEIREREQGPNHPDVATVLNNLAVLKAAGGDYDAAQPMLERALAIRESALGKDDPLTAQSLSNLALLHAARGDAAAAEPLYQRSLAILDAAEGDRSHAADLQRVLENYAALLRDVGRDGEAEKLEARARVVGSIGGQPIGGAPE